MRILYQSFGDIDRTPDYRAAVHELTHTAASDGTQVDVVGLHGAVLAGKQYRPFQDLDTAALLGQLLRTAGSYDALVLGNTMDPGLVAARQTFDVPVLGLFETSLAVASLVCRRVYVVCSHPVMVPRVTEQVAAAGWRDRVAAVDALGDAFNVPHMAGGFGDPERGREAADAFTRAVAERMPADAEAVLPASGILQVLLWKQGVTEVQGAPLINGVAASIPIAESLVRLRRSLGLGVSRRGTYVELPQELRDQLRALHEP